MSTSKLCVNAERNEGRKPGEDSKQLFRQGEQETGIIPTVTKSG